MIHLLIVDDDESILQLGQAYFTPLDFQVYTACNGEQALEVVKSIHLDCIVLDISLPGQDGFEICSSIRELSDVPIIFLSNYLEEDKRIHGFLAGGDDYMTKPYSHKELELRIYARVRQHKERGTIQDIMAFGPLVINATTKQAFYNYQDLKLTSMEIDILVFLAENQPKVFSNQEIYNQVWKMPDLGNIHTVQVQIARLRQKLNAICTEHSYIQTAWGKGYRFVP